MGLHCGNANRTYARPFGTGLGRSLPSSAPPITRTKASCAFSQFASEFRNAPLSLGGATFAIASERISVP